VATGQKSGSEPDHLPLSKAKVKSELRWVELRCISTTPCAIMKCADTSLILTFVIAVFFDTQTINIYCKSWVCLSIKPVKGHVK